jgi:hypothetical protein
MRLIGYIISMLIVLLLFTTAIYKVSKFNFLAEQSSMQSNNYSRSRIFYFPETNQLNFNIPANTQQIRVLLNAELPTINSASQVAVGFQLGGQVDTKISQDVKFKAGSLTEENLPKSARFFSQLGGAIASLTYEQVIDIPLGTDKLYLSISPYSRKVAARVYALESVENKKAELEWKRSHPEQKKSLVVPHIYPPELIEPTERLNATSSQWRTVGPEGVKDTDYYSDFILIKNEVVTKPEENKSQAEIYISQQSFYTHTDFDSLEAAQFSCQTMNNHDSIVFLEYVDAKTNQLMQKQYILSKNKIASIPLGLGMVKFSAESPCYLNFYNDIGRALKITPLKRFSHLLSQLQSLEFKLNPNARELQALKLDVRALLSSDPEQTPPIALNWTLLDELGETIEQSTKLLKLDLNPYEYQLKNESVMPVSLKNQWYVLADKQAATLRLSVSGGEVLTKVYGRPLNLPLLLQKNKVEETMNEELSPVLTWFKLKPISINADQQKIDSYWSPAFKVPSAKPDSWTSEWRSLIQNDSFVSSELFYLRDVAHAKPSKSSFVKIPKLSTVSFESTYNRPSFSPEIVFIRQYQEPEQVKVFLNDELLMKTWLFNKTGSFRLPNISVGQHKLELKSGEKIAFYINNMTTQLGATAQKASATLLEDSLTLSFNKSSVNEWLTIRYFPVVSNKHKISLELQADYSEGIRTELTLPKRVFHYTTNTTSDVFILNQEDRTAYSPVTLLIPLKADLAQKNYKINIRTSISRSGYLQAGYLIDQVSGKSIIFTEENSDDPY